MKAPIAWIISPIIWTTAACIFRFSSSCECVCPSSCECPWSWSCVCPWSCEWLWSWSWSCVCPWSCEWLWSWSCECSLLCEWLWLLLISSCSVIIFWFSNVSFIDNLNDISSGISLSEKQSTSIFSLKNYSFFFLA